MERNQKETRPPRRKHARRHRPRKGKTRTPQQHALACFVKQTILQLDTKLTNPGYNNVSNFTLTNQQHKVLALGAQFIYPRTCSRSEMQKDIDHYKRSIRIKFLFSSFKNPKPRPKLYVPNPNYTPPEASTAIEQYLDQVKNGIMDDYDKHASKPRIIHGINIQEHNETIKSLLEEERIVIKLADKNLGLTIMDKTHYIQLVESHLQDRTTYKLIEPQQVQTNMDRIQKRTQREICNIIRVTEQSARGTDVDALQLYRYLSQNLTNYTIPQFYIMPKLHKTPISSRPISAAHSFITTWLGKWIDLQLKQLLPNFNTICNSTTTVIQAIDKLTLPPNTVLMTGDVEALYPNIDTEFALRTIGEYVFNNLEHGSTVMSILRFLLTDHFTEFNNQTYQQISGTAMGVPFAVSYANLVLAICEQNIVQNFNQEIQLYLRFVDDILTIFTGTEERRLQFQEQLNEIHPKIKITWNTSDFSIDYLDLTIYRASSKSKATKLLHRTFIKPMNKALYLPYQSFHPKHTKIGFINTEIHRLLRNSSTESVFEEDRRYFYANLRARGYPPYFLNKIFYDKMNQYNTRPKLLLQPTKPNPNPNIITPSIFKTHYNDFTMTANLQQHLHPHTKMTPQENAIIGRVIIAYQTGKSLQDYLISAKFKPTQEEGTTGTTGTEYPRKRPREITPLPPRKHRRIFPDTNLSTNLSIRTQSRTQSRI